MKKKHLVILGAGLPHFGSKASAIYNIIKNIMSLSFILNYSKNDISKISFVSGYNYLAIKKKFPKLKLIYNKNWKKTGPIYSLSLAEISEDEDLIIIYSDILIRKFFFKNVVNSKSDLTISHDSYYKKRYVNRSKIDVFNKEKIIFLKNKYKFKNKFYPRGTTSELLGLIKISSSKVFLLKEYFKKKKKINKLKLFNLLEYLSNYNLKKKFIDSKGDWCELNNKIDISQFILGSKSETLMRLKNVLNNSTILDQIKFNVKEWNFNKQFLINKIKQKFKNKSLIVRSSSKDEDSFIKSNAGKYLSILNISSEKSLKNAVAKIINSFGKRNSLNEIFVQEYIGNAKYVGVITTKSKETGSPWYVVNYQKTSDTQIITKGDTNKIKTIFIRKDANSKVINNLKFSNLIIAIKEIENLLLNNDLDIEFAINKDDSIIIFQIRPLTGKFLSNNETSRLLNSYKKSEKKFKNFKIKSKINNYSSKIFGVMPDWNPAEIIGFKPNPLSLSIYEELITNKIWSKQRYEFGYRKILSTKLLTNFSGTSYVCVNKSLESFIPQKIPNKLAKKILNISIELLKNNKTKHDKIEFDIIPNCLDFNFYKWKKIFQQNKINDSQINIIKNCLLNINSNAQKKYAFYSNIIKEYEFNYKDFERLDDKDKIKKSLNICKNNLTKIFAHFARCGFISVIIFKSALQNKIITEKQYNSFFNSIRTVSKTFQEDINFYIKKKFQKKY